MLLCNFEQFRGIFWLFDGFPDEEANAGIWYFGQDFGFWVPEFNYPRITRICPNLLEFARIGRFEKLRLFNAQIVYPQVGGPFGFPKSFHFENHAVFDPF